MSQRILRGAVLVSVALVGRVLVELTPTVVPAASRWQEGLAVLPEEHHSRISATRMANHTSPAGEKVQALSPTGTNQTVERIPTTTTTRRILRHDWRQAPPLSPLALELKQHQSDCSLPVATFHVDNAFGLGSHLALWSQSVCNAMEIKARLRTHNPVWLWMDQNRCDMLQAQKSPLLCYFPKSEFQCGENERLSNPPVNVSDPRYTRDWCRRLRQSNPKKIVKTRALDEFRAASTEFLFSHLSPLVIQEAERQAALVFGHQPAPPDLVTVHMRWGDKFWEMNLAPEQEYIQAVSDLLRADGRDNATANIYLATEDPKALEAFVKKKPEGWKVWYDRTLDELNDVRPVKGNRASHAAKNSQGRAGLVALGSLLLSMEAKYYVLTTASNWSRLMEQLRTQIIDPACGNCTRRIDLRPGIW